MVLKGIGLVGGAMLSSFVGALGQWANAGEWPSSLQWLIIAGTTAGAGMSALVAFLSTSYGDWRKESTGGAHGG